MHTFWHNPRYIFQSRYFSVLLTPLGLNFSTRCNWTKVNLASKLCKVFWFRFCNFSSAASLQLQLILCFGLSAFPIIDLIPLWPFPFSLLLIWNFGYHSSSAFIWFCTLRIRGSIPAQRAGLPASLYSWWVGPAHWQCLHCGHPGRAQINCDIGHQIKKTKRVQVLLEN